MKGWKRIRSVLLWDDTSQEDPCSKPWRKPQAFVYIRKLYPYVLQTLSWISMNLSRSPWMRTLGILALDSKVFSSEMDRDPSRAPVRTSNSNPPTIGSASDFLGAGLLEKTVTEISKVKIGFKHLVGDWYQIKSNLHTHTIINVYWTIWTNILVLGQNRATQLIRDLCLFWDGIPKELEGSPTNVAMDGHGNRDNLKMNWVWTFV